MTLFIIGNGFDLNHGYQTCYTQFRYFLKYGNYYAGDFNIYEPFECFDDAEWNNFEDELENIDFTDWASWYSDDFPENLSDKDFDKSIKNNDYLIDEFDNFNKKFPIRLTQALENFIVEAIENFDAKPKIYFQNIFTQDSIFINFNYTRTLENLYNIEQNKIEYIHGIAKNISYDRKKGDIDYSMPDIIFGHGNFIKKEHNISGAEYDNNIFYPQNSLMYLSDNLAKNYQLKKIKDFIALHPNISNVEIIGHSLGKIDAPYFKCLNNLIDKNVKIFYWLHKKEEENEKMDMLKSLFAGHEIEMKDYPDPIQKSV